MKKGFTIIEFVMAILLLVVIGHLLISTTNILKINTNHSIYNQIKEEVFSYMSKANLFCLNHLNTEQTEEIVFFGNQKLEMNTICINISDKMKEILVRGCLKESNYCYEHKGFLYVE